VRIWIDGDGCPKSIRKIIIKAGKRRGIPVIFISDRTLPELNHSWGELITVESGDQAVDRYLSGVVEKDDLVITKDIPLAADCIDKEALVMDDRGTLYTKDNIGERLSTRNFLSRLRESGVGTVTGSFEYGKREVKAFSDLLDRTLTRLCKGKKNS
jgi:hypothetical protein